MLVGINLPCAPAMTKPLGHTTEREGAAQALGSPALLFERYAPYVGRIALRLLGSHNDIDDIVQDVFLEAFPRLDDVRNAEALPGWLAVITTRVVARRLRRRSLRRLLGLSDMPSNVPERAVEATAEQRVLLRQIYDVLNQCKAEQRIAWALRYFEGLTLEEVAETSGCSLAAVKRRIAAVQERMDRRSIHG